MNGQLKRFLALVLSVGMMLSAAPAVQAEEVASAPQQEITAEVPTSAPVVEAPTAAPVVEAPTAAPVIEAPTAAPVAEEPTAVPVAEEPTAAPVAEEPTAAPVVEEPTAEPVVAEPTDEPAPEVRWNKQYAKVKGDSAVYADDHGREEAGTLAGGSIVYAFARRETENENKDYLRVAFSVDGSVKTGWMKVAALSPLSEAACAEEEARRDQDAEYQGHALKDAAYTVKSEPAAEPTPAPVDEPTAAPVDEPTAAPMDEPTAAPMDEPTAAPVDEPTAAPVDEPTAAPMDEPTAAPMDEPTAAPVDEPTAVPVDEPTAAPVDEPTAAPVDEPTAAPVDEPTAAPVDEPTEEPSDEELYDEEGNIITNNVPGYFPIKTLSITMNDAIAPASATVDMAKGPIELGVTYTPVDAYPEMSWTTSNDKIAYVNPDGMVTFVTPGTVTITVEATDGSNKKDTIKLTAVKYVTEIVMPESEVVLTTKKLQLKPTVLPEDATNKKLVWSTTSKLVTVSSAGLVTVKAGAEFDDNVIITAKAADGSDVSAEYRLTVQPITTSVKFVDASGNALPSKYTADRTLLHDVNGLIDIHAVTLPETALDDVVYTSSKPAVVFVEDGKLYAVSAGTATITATAQDGSGKNVRFNVTVVISPANMAIEGAEQVGAGKSTQLTVTMRPADVSNKKVVWSVDNTAYAAISSSGRLTAKATAGGQSVTVTAKSAMNGEVLAQKTVQIMAPATSVQLYMNGSLVPKTITCDPSDGEDTVNLSAAVLPETASQEVTWKSSNVKVATVDNAGCVTVLAKGTAKITATATDGSGRSAYVSIVSAPSMTGIEITAPAQIVLPGKSLQLKVQAVPSSLAAPRVTWTSSDTTLATVSSSGKVTAKAGKAGNSVVITATSSAYTATYEVFIVEPTKSVTICDEGGQPVGASIGVVLEEKGQVLPLDVVTDPDDVNEPERSVTWTSSSSSVVKIVNGEIQLLKPGKAVLTAKAVDSGVKDTVTVYVADADSDVTIIADDTTLAAGTSLQLSASITPATASQKVVWTSGNTAMATVSSTGKVTAKRGVTGTVVIKAAPASGVGKNAEIELTIVPAATKVTICQDNVPVTTLDYDLCVDDPEFDLTAIVTPEDAIQGVTWKSSNAKIASIDEAGHVTMRTAGTVTLTATAADGSKKYATCKLIIRGLATGVAITGPAEVLGGTKIKLTAVVSPTTANNKKVKWTSSNTSVATVDGNGYVTGKNLTEIKTVQITATAADGSGEKDTVTITVVPAAATVTFEQKVIEMQDQDTYQLEPVFKPVSAGNAVAYTSTNESVATVDKDGLVTAHSVGTAVIRVTLDTGKSATVTIKVLLRELTVELFCSHSGTVESGTEVTWTAETSFTDGVTYDYTLYLNNEIIKEVKDSLENEFRYTLTSGGSYEVVATVRADQNRQDSMLSEAVLVNGELKYEFFVANFTANGVTITGYTGTDAKVDVPEDIGDVAVVAIGAEAFMNNTTLTEITLPNTVTVIGARAFKGCTNLKTMKTK